MIILRKLGKISFAASFTLGFHKQGNYKEFVVERHRRANKIFQPA